MRTDIQEIHDNGLLVMTVDFDDFDRASVGYGEGLEISFNLIENIRFS